jgi:bifunctional ADP-heptose synthase (sugar kinase/adenylyltransferase)
VTLVTWFEKETPLQLILASKPDVLVKGGDWKPEAIVGAAEVKSWGGAVHSIPLLAGRSTTSVISRIRGLKS